MSQDPNALKIVDPFVITDAILDVSGSPPATNVPEDDYPEWDLATTYDEGDRVILASTHRVYESVLSGNTNNDPTVISSPIYWIEVGPTNRWAVFDAAVSTQTKQANNITYSLIAGTAVNTIAALNISNGTEINITVTSPSAGSPGIVYQKTIDLTAFPLIADWYNWFFGIRKAPTQTIQTDLPSYTDAVITFELLGGSDLAIGVLLIGQQATFGLGIKYGARVGIQDYSRKETNEFGDVVLVQRAFAKRANFELFLDKAETDILQTFLSEIRAKPVLWIGSTEYESTTLYGFYKNFDILISYAEHSDCELQIEGLT